MDFKERKGERDKRQRERETSVRCLLHAAQMGIKHAHFAASDNSPTNRDARPGHFFMFKIK